MSLSPRSRPATGRIVAGIVLVALLVLTVVAIATGAFATLLGGLFPPPAATVEGSQIRSLYDLVFFLAAAVFLLVEGLIIWSVIRYHRKPDDDELPPQTHGNNLAEIVWTVIPTVVVAILFVASWQTLNSIEVVSDEPGLEVRARAGQFQWTFEYLAEDGETVEYTQFLPTGDNGGMFVPVGEPVKVHLESPDVVHAFYVPRFLFKLDVVPGVVNTFDFTVNPEEAGQTFRGQCAELCGTGHRAMVFDVHALTRADFDAWLADAKATAQPSAAPEGSAPPPAATLAIAAEALAFDTDTLEAPADQPFAIDFDNQDAGVPHDVAISGPSGLAFNGEDITGPEQISYQVPPLAAGEYEFLCTIHPQMSGTLTVQ